MKWRKAIGQCSTYAAYRPLLFKTITLFAAAIELLWIR